MKDIDQNGPSFWPGIPQGNLNAANRSHIDLLCTAFGVGPWNLRVNWEKANFGDLFSVFNLPPYGGEMATADGDALTRLVFAAHDRCIRVSVSPHTFKQLSIMMHSRRGREGGVGSRHMTVEGALKQWRRHYVGELGEVTDERLIKSAVKNARDVSTRGLHPRWVGVKHTFSVGKTAAHELCRRFDLDPDEQVKI